MYEFKKKRTKKKKEIKKMRARASERSKRKHGYELFSLHPPLPHPYPHRNVNEFSGL